MSLKPSVRGDIEGLRAIAVTWVVLFHISSKWFPGGFAGVDVFFVISGFLITWQLAKEWERDGSVSIPGFYARRARRLLPAATVVLVFCVVGGWLLLARSTWRQQAFDVGAAALYVVNWVFADRSVDYLAHDVDSVPSLVQHYWSLSIEEQFYLVWPAVMVLALFLARRMQWSSRRLIFWFLAGIFAASLICSVIQTELDAAPAYFLTTTRIWELALGALVALAIPLWQRRLGRRTAVVLAGGGLLGIGLTAVLVTASTPWPGSAALLPTLSCAAVLAAGTAQPDTVVARVLGVAPLRWLGGLSYGIYLWHWPLIVLAQSVGGKSLRWTAGAVVAGVLAAWLTKKFVEDPLRFHPKIAASKGLALLMTLILMAISVGVAVWHALTPRPSGTELPRPDAKASSINSEWTAFGPMSFVDFDRSNGPSMVLNPGSTSAWSTAKGYRPDPLAVDQDVPKIYAAKCQVATAVVVPRTDCLYGAKKSTFRVVLFGDSKATQWFTPLELIAERERWALEVQTKAACPPYSEITEYAGKPYPQCKEWSNAVVDRLVADPPELVVISQGQPLPADKPGKMTSKLARLVQAGSKLVFLEDSLAYDLPGYARIADCLHVARNDQSPCSYPRVPGAGSGVMKAAADDLHAPYLEIASLSCPPGLQKCPAAVGGVPVYRQGHHVTDTLAAWTAPWFHREFIRLGMAQTSPLGVDSLG